MATRPHVHITGASGAGVTTIGRALAERLDCAAFDTDDFYWLPTTPPYRQPRPIAERLELLREVFAGAERGWVLSGSVGSWGDPLIPRMDLVVYVDTPTEVRLERLRVREAARFGAESIAPGGERHAEFVAFLEWASRYDHGDREGRSRQRHAAWLAGLTCPVERVDGTRPVAQIVGELAEVWLRTTMPRTPGRP